MLRGIEKSENNAEEDKRVRQDSNTALNLRPAVFTYYIVDLYIVVLLETVKHWNTLAMLQILKIRLMMSSSMSADINSTWMGP